GALAEALQPGAPGGDAVAPAAPFRDDDVEPEEPEPAGVAHDRAPGHRLVADPADEETLRVGRAEGRGVVEPAVPALPGGTLDRAVDVPTGRRRGAQLPGHGRC